MEAYPAMLPGFQADDYSYEDSDDLVRTEMEGGPTRVRRRARQSGTVFTVSSKMSAHQLETFEAWYKLKIGGGVDWFTVSLPVGVGGVIQTARFVGKPGTKKSGPRAWVVTAVVEVEQKPTLTAEELGYVLDYDGLAELLARVINVEMPTALGVGLWV